MYEYLSPLPYFWFDQRHDGETTSFGYVRRFAITGEETAVGRQSDGREQCGDGRQPRDSEWSFSSGGTWPVNLVRGKGHRSELGLTRYLDTAHERASVTDHGVDG